MDIRKLINDKPGIGIGIAAGVILLAVLLIYITSHGAGQVPSGPVGAADKIYYSDDDGATWFADTHQITPFKHNGKDAVKAMVFTCGGKPFVGYLERETAAAKKQSPTGQPVVGGRRPRVGKTPLTEVKKPGAANSWIQVTSVNILVWQKVTDVHCPDGETGVPEPVFPEGARKNLDDDK